MRREGEWIRVYRAHHKADTMVTAGHIAKAMRNIDDEARKNDWVLRLSTFPVSAEEWVDRLAELELPVTLHRGGEAPIDKERFVNARAEDFWTLRERGSNRARSTSTQMTTSSPPSSARSSGASTLVDGIRIESKDDMCKRGPSSPDRADAMAIAFAGRANAAPMNVECHAGESIAGDSADEGVVGQPSPKRGTAI
jgi:hypothetical protein